MMEDFIHIADISCNAWWKYIDKKYIPQTELYIGNVKIAYYFYDGSCNSDDNKKYKVQWDIFPDKYNSTHYETEEECRAICLEMARKFCEELQNNIGYKKST